MDEFELDSGLHETLRIIRENVRRLFDQLRLRGEVGDATGAARLERVPALAKRNFGQLSDPNPDLAIREAWRLIDFLEGSDRGRLSANARQGLRVTELDQQLSRFRASDRWKGAAAGLREAVSAPSGGPAASSAVAGAAVTPPNAHVHNYEEKPAGETPSANIGRLTEPAHSTGKPRRWSFRKASAALFMLAAATVVVIWWSRPKVDPRMSCIPLESASADTLAEHWVVRPLRALPRPPVNPHATSHVFPISDPPGGPVQSIWMTSTYSYGERTTRAGPGGGVSDFRLRVGGWGDTYVSLLRVPVPTDRLVQKAVIQLTVLGEPDVRPTSMTLRGITESWHVDSGPNDRLWWRDCPQSTAIRNHLPPPGPSESVYEVDITDLYNIWARGLGVSHGILLEPEHIGQWGSHSPHYANFNTFYSTRVPDVGNRPRLILTY